MINDKINLLLERLDAFASSEAYIKESHIRLLEKASANNVSINILYQEIVKVRKTYDELLDQLKKFNENCKLKNIF